MDSELLSIIYIMILGLGASGTLICLGYRNSSSLLGMVGYSILGVVVYMASQIGLRHISLPSIFYANKGILQTIIGFVLACVVLLVGFYLGRKRIKKEKNGQQI